MKTKLFALFIFGVLIPVFGQDFGSWKTYDYQDLGLKYKIPSCGFTDDEDCIGIDLLNEVYEGELVFLVGIVSKFSDEYEEDHPYAEDAQENGQLPSVTLKNYPDLLKKASFSEHFFDSESYVLRYFFPLKNNYFFKIEIEGYFEDLEDDDAAVKYFFENLSFSGLPQNQFLNDQELTNLQEGPLKSKISSKLVKVDGIYDGARPKLRCDKNGNIYMVWVHVENGVCFSKLDKNGQILSTVTLPDEGKGYMNYVLLDNGFAVASSKNSYEIEEKKEPKNYYSSLEVEAFDFSGKKLWSTTVMPEIVITKDGDRGFQGYVCEMERSDSEILVHFPVRGKWPDGLIHQGDAYFTLDLKGNLIEDFRNGWHVSHSFEQEVLVDGSYFGLFSLGDAYPRGINYAFFDTKNTDVRGEINLFPFAGKTGWNYVGDTQFSNAIFDDENVYMVISTEENIKSKGTELSTRENDLVLLVVSKKGEKVLEKNLTNTPAIDEGEVQIAFQGENILVTHRTNGYYVDMPNNYADHYMVISKKGAIVSPKKMLRSHGEYFIQKWTKMGNDIMLWDHPSPSDFIELDNEYIFTRVLPFYHSDHIELVRIKK